MKRWEIQNSDIDKHKDLDTEEIIKILLKNRGIDSAQKIDDFLNPSLERITIQKVGINQEQIEKAVTRIITALNKKESIVVYADYDADGVCSAAIIWQTLYQMGARVMPYIPDRLKEGYGLSKYGIDYVKKIYQADLIITVDHGISSLHQINYARERGIDIIVVDHHQKSEQVPKVPLVHTQEMAAGGIAWFFTKYFMDKYKGAKISFEKAKKISKINLQFACLSTIADLVPLLGVNRTIVKIGLEQMQNTEQIGLKALIQECGISKGQLDTYTIGHIIAPRINAMGRIDHALDSLRLICTKDKQRAFYLSQKLSKINKDRQLLVEEALNLARNKILNKSKIEKLLFLADEKFHQGIIGLIAGKLTEEYNRPSVVIAKTGEISKASVRSIKGLDIISIIEKVKEFLIDAGGHPMAAGFSIATNNIEKLKERLTEIVDKSMSEKLLEKVLKIDLVLNLDQLSLSLSNALAVFKPTGIGNPEPVFASYQVDILEAKLIGRKKNHLKIIVKGRNNLLLEAVGFDMGKIFSQLCADTPVDIAYSIYQNNWNGRTRLQLKLKDIHISTKNSSCKRP